MVTELDDFGMFFGYTTGMKRANFELTEVRGFGATKEQRINADELDAMELHSEFDDELLYLSYKPLKIFQCGLENVPCTKVRKAPFHSAIRALKR